MLMGADMPLRSRRVSIHCLSPHPYSSDHARDAVAGGTSLWKANGSARSSTCPCVVRIAYLYAWARFACGTYASQMPELSQRAFMTSTPRFQPFQSPMMET